MAEVKNSFLSSKMNKDLDDRLVPNNEYRDALNVLVGKSENSDVGVLQSIPGNDLVGYSGNYYLTCIGRIADNANNRIIEFLTNYNDPSPSSITNVPNSYLTYLTTTAFQGEMSITLFSVDTNVVKPGQTIRTTPYSAYYPYEQVYIITQVEGNTVYLNKPVISDIDNITPIFIDYSMKIVIYSTTSSVVETLVSGTFLNFATNNAFTVTGVNIIEDLLFWTDNRNQPRKININTALSDSTYYSNESQISVAKYNPLTPISLFDKVQVTSVTGSVSTSGYTTFIVSLSDATLLKIGLQLISNTVDISSYAIINNISIGVSNATITLTGTSVYFIGGTTLTFYDQLITDASSDADWKGDASFLKDKYIRFSYRYKFNDGEYSLMAPFTQIIYIPTQKGYFFGEDETRAYTSTVLKWVENYVNNVILLIQLPCIADSISSEYLIDKVDILYKESDSLNIKVLETVDNSYITNNSVNNILTFQYSSQKPYKTLPEQQLTRVYDKVPIRARAQEVSGNRVIYGNFIATNTSPDNINYDVSINNKSKNFESWIEYPNHTLKQNRTYQVGIVLADKFGRQSPVILSGSSQQSTIYAPFSKNTTSVKSWVGNALNITFNSIITSNDNESSGEPGLYAIISGGTGLYDGFQVSASYLYSVAGYGTYAVNNTINFTLSSGVNDPKNIPVIGGYLRGEYVDYVKVIANPTGGVYITDGTINSSYQKKSVTNDIKYAYSINQLGWYSYKIVVKQQQQDYYNVYLPGMLNGYPSYQTSGLVKSPTVFPTSEINRIAHTVLINDNINKVPRDLSQVGPDQKQYRSSVNLFCRVNNVVDNTAYNTQYFPSNKADVVSTIATSNELNFLPYSADENPNGTATVNFYQFDTSPLIARISTTNSVGTLAAPTLATYNYQNLMVPMLSVYETTPDVSLLDLYWESTTAGYISDLNESILLGSDSIVNLSSIGFSFSEQQDPNGIDTGTGTANSPWVTDYFWPTSNGLPMTNSNVSINVVNVNNDTVSIFEIVRYAPISPATYYTYRIKIKQSVDFVYNYALFNTWNFTFNITNNSNGSNSNIIINGLSLINNAPTITYPSVDNTNINVPVNSPSGSLLKLLGTNGSSSLNLTNTSWSIVDVSPTVGASFQLDQNTGVLSTNIKNAGNYVVTTKLTDAYNSATNSPTLASLTLNRIINISSNNIVIFNIYGTSTRSTFSGGYSVSTQGTLDVWKSLWPGETITTNNISIDLFHTSSGGSTDYIPYAPTITYNNDFTFSFNFKNSLSPTGSSNPLSSPVNYVRFSGTFTTSNGRVINLKTINPYPGSISPYISMFLFQQYPTYYVATGDVNYRPGSSSTSVSWSVKNNSSNTSWFTGLGRYGNLIVGGYINTGQTITGGFNTNNCVRNTSIYTESVTPAFTITYGSTC